MIQEKHKNPNIKIPIIVDVERIIDEIPMIRCSYYAIQSDKPMTDWTINAGDTRASMLLLNLEAILVGPPQKEHVFRDKNDVALMYQFVEDQDALFVDINDIWIPLSWFGNNNVKQGQLYRIGQEEFSICWQFRHDMISAEELTEFTKDEVKDESSIEFSEMETEIFHNWTQEQIEQSRKIYQNERSNYLTKIKE